MAHRNTLRKAVSTTFVLSLSCTCLALESQQPRPGEAAMAAGIVTDGLSPAQLRVWKSIVEIVKASDKGGRIRHPTLYALYHRIESCSHLVRIEFTQTESMARAGQFTIEKLDPKNLRHEVTIHLNLATIRQAHVGENVRHHNGLIPFAGLDTKQRYAEVLGHELAHAVSVFQSAEMQRLYQQLEREASAFDATNLNEGDADVLACLERIRQLKLQIEEPAEAAELEIWRELGPSSLISRPAKVSSHLQYR